MFLVSVYFDLISHLQKKPPSKRGPPVLQKRSNMSDWQVKDKKDTVVRRDEEQEKETKTVIRYSLNTLVFQHLPHMRLLIIVFMERP